MFCRKNPDASGKELVSLGIYKLFKKDIDIPNNCPSAWNMIYYQRWNYVIKF